MGVRDSATSMLSDISSSSSLVVVVVVVHHQEAWRRIQIEIGSNFGFHTLGLFCTTANLGHSTDDVLLLTKSALVTKRILPWTLKKHTSKSH